MQTESLNRQWRLHRRPQGMLENGDLVIETEPVPIPAEGQVLVKTTVLSVDPTNRIWMSDTRGYMPAVGIGEVMRGLGMGVIQESKAKEFEKGDIVTGMWGFQEYACVAAEEVNKIPKTPLPTEAWMSVLGITGLTAYFGLLDIGKPKEGETLLVTGAAGAVGSIVGQIGKIKGCRVVGVAGSDEKCKWLKEELKFDEAINYKTQNMSQALKQACPKGIDIIFENVGGDLLSASLAEINLNSRIVLCGLISQYNQYNSNGTKVKSLGPENFDQILMQRAKLEGFIVLDYMHQFHEAIPELINWVSQGKIKFKTQSTQGFESVPEALKMLFAGANTGKLLVNLNS